MRSTPPNLRPNIGVDSVTWLLAHNGNFSVKTAQDALKTPLPIVLWAPIVLFKQDIPRWAFIMWLVCCGRLTTKDRLLSLGMRVKPLCILCQNVNDSHVHLFFNYPFSACIWGRILHLLGFSRYPMEQKHEINWAVQSLKKKGFSSTLYKLAMAGTMYYIWKARNRNDSVLGNKQYTPDTIYDPIVNDVRDRVFSWRSSGHNPINSALCRAWNISDQWQTQNFIALGSSRQASNI